MADYGELCRDMREHARQRKNERLAKFNDAFGFIQGEAKSIGWSVYRDDGCWEFSHGETEMQVLWWPQRGRTSKGESFSTWPLLKAHLEKIAREAQ